jgi:FtsH-binding integral membrane protein
MAYHRPDDSLVHSRTGNSPMNRLSNEQANWNTPWTRGDMMVAAEAPVADRVTFIRKTYLHLAGAILAFTALMCVIMQLPITGQFVQMMGASRGGMLILMLAFMGVAYGAQRLAQSEASAGMQYLGLGLYILIEAVIFTPLIYIAANFGPPNVLLTAAGATAALFVGLTVVVFVTKADFSFLRIVLTLAGIASILAILASFIFGFSLGIWFTVGMIFLASCYITYDTSNILHHYRTTQHVAASLALFASVMLLFWYILRFFMQRRD